jgi:hypothetical protein
MGPGPSWTTVVWCLLTNPLLRLQNAWLRLVLAWFRWREARLDRKLRKHGIDPDAIPEIQELRRRYEQAQGDKATDTGS